MRNIEKSGIIFIYIYKYILFHVYLIRHFQSPACGSYNTSQSSFKIVLAQSYGSV